MAINNPPQRFCDFIACQAKTLSFLTYLLRGFAHFMRRYENTISQCVVSLLQTCPSDAITTRKELLVATRHILATDFRQGFFAQISMLLNQNTLIGSSRAAFDSLRPLAYSTLADLVHHVRARLNMTQLARIIFLFSRNINDDTLPLTIQTTSVRLLLNLVDNIFHNKDQDKSNGRKLLVRILSTLVNKFESLRLYIPKLLAWQRERVAVEKHDNRGGTVYDYEMMLEKGLPPPQLRAPSSVSKAPSVISKTKPSASGNLPSSGASMSSINGVKPGPSASKGLAPPPTSNNPQQSQQQQPPVPRMPSQNLSLRMSHGSMPPASMTMPTYTTQKTPLPMQKSSRPFPPSSMPMQKTSIGLQKPGAYAPMSQTMPSQPPAISQLKSVMKMEPMPMNMGPNNSSGNFSSSQSNATNTLPQQQQQQQIHMKRPTQPMGLGQQTPMPQQNTLPPQQLPPTPQQPMQQPHQPQLQQQQQPQQQPMQSSSQMPPQPNPQPTPQTAPQLNPQTSMQMPPQTIPQMNQSANQPLKLPQKPNPGGSLSQQQPRSFTPQMQPQTPLNTPSMGNAPALQNPPGLPNQNPQPTGSMGVSMLSQPGSQQQQQFPTMPQSGPFQSLQTNAYQKPLQSLPPFKAQNSKQFSSSKNNPLQQPRPMSLQNANPTMPGARQQLPPTSSLSVGKGLPRSSKGKPLHGSSRQLLGSSVTLCVGVSAESILGYTKVKPFKSLNPDLLLSSAQKRLDLEAEPDASTTDKGKKEKSEASATAKAKRSKANSVSRSSKRKRLKKRKKKSSSDRKKPRPGAGGGESVRNSSTTANDTSSTFDLAPVISTNTTSGPSIDTVGGSSSRGDTDGKTNNRSAGDGNGDSQDLASASKSTDNSKAGSSSKRKADVAGKQNLNLDSIPSSIDNKRAQKRKDAPPSGEDQNDNKSKQEELADLHTKRSQDIDQVLFRPWPHVIVGLPSSDGIKEVKGLVKTMILGLKTVVWCVSNYNSQTAGKDKKVNHFFLCLVVIVRAVRVVARSMAL